MTISPFLNVRPSIFVGPLLIALAACPPNDKLGTTAEPQNENTTSDASTSDTTSGASTSPTTSGASTSPTTSGASTSPTTSASASSGLPSTSTDETTSSEPDTGSTSSTTASSEPDTGSTSSTTTLEPDTTGGDACLMPDLTPSLALGFEKCKPQLVLVATIHNVGTAEVPPGIDVLFFKGTDASGPKLGAKPTSEALPGGSSTDVVWVVDFPPDEPSNYYVEVDSGLGGGSIVECDETNNSDLVTDAACPD